MRRHASRLAVVMAATAVLAGCEQRAKPVAGLCKPFPAAAPASTDNAAVVEDCLHRWSYALAGAADDAGTVAEAVVAACGAPMSRWSQQALAQATPDAPSLLTGEATNPIAQRASFAKTRALFYVTQARAGGCKPPPKREGAAAMSAPDA